MFPAVIFRAGPPLLVCSLLLFFTPNILLIFFSIPDTLPIVVEYTLKEILDIIPRVTNQYGVNVRTAWQNAVAQVFTDAGQACKYSFICFILLVY
jgi:hypothetical protein